VNLEFALEAPNFTSSDDQLRKWWPMRPNTGLLWADLLWLLVVGAMDSYIFPSVTFGLMPFNLMAPWLVVTFVTAPTAVSFFVFIMGTLILETNSAVPRGMYLTSYWVIFSVLILARKTLSWRHTVPWLVTFFSAAFFICNFEMLLIFMRQDPTQLDFFYFAKQVIRVTLCVLAGMTLAQPWMMRFKGESAK
jgi:hypothetical protein